MVKKDKIVKKIIQEDILKRKVIIYKDILCDNGPSLLKLRHPQHRGEAIYLFSQTENDAVIQEVLKYEDDKRSYFIDNSVSSDGNVYLSVPIDPLFLILPYLEKETRCCPIDHIIHDADYPETEFILKCSGIKYLHQIADQRGDPSINAYAYNEEKVIKWLEKKMKRLVELLKQEKIHVSINAATSANFVKSEKNQDSEDSYMTYAFGIISDYLSDSLSSKLAQFINLPEIEVNISKKRKLDQETSKTIKHAKLEEIHETTPQPIKQEKKAKPGKKTQEMAKAAKGSKSISSFFKKV